MTNFKDLLDSAFQYYKEGAAIWNLAGLDNPGFVRDAAQSALSQYENAISILAAIKLLPFRGAVPRSILAYEAFFRGEAAYLTTFLYDHWDDEGLQQILEIAEEEVIQRKTALAHFKALNVERDLLLRRDVELLAAQGRKATFSARLASRMDNPTKAKKLYEEAAAAYKQIMCALEKESSELSSITTGYKKEVTTYKERVWETDERGDGEHAFGSMIGLTFARDKTDSPHEDLYRRAAANFYSSASLVANLEGLEVLQSGGGNEDVDQKLEESTELLYQAMSVFPDNLEYHQDLFNSWRVRGELLGCPIEETDKYYHFRCPLAIIHYFGKWYVSPTLEYESLRCSVCGMDALDCLHYSGENVDGEIVYYKPSGVVVSSVSLVDVPEDPECRIEYGSIPKSYFANIADDSPRLRCYFCHPELFENLPYPFILDLTDDLRSEAGNQYRKIMNSKRLLHRIEVPIEKADRNDVDNETVS